VAERSQSPSGAVGHRCPRGIAKCGTRRLFASLGIWYCSRCCELLGAARERALGDPEINELSSLIAAQAQEDRAEAAA